MKSSFDKFSSLEPSIVFSSETKSSICLKNQGSIDVRSKIFSRDHPHLNASAI